MYYFIVNRTGGSGRAAKTWHKVRMMLRNNQMEYKAFLTKYEGHATVLAKNISRLPDSEIKLIVVGGDGTVNEVLNGIEDFDRVSLGVIATGSANDFINGIGIPRDTEAAIQRILDPKDNLTIDIGRVTADGRRPRYFGISCGVGLDAIVCKKALTSKLKRFLNKLGCGSLTYVILTVVNLFTMEYIRANVRYSMDEAKTEDDYNSEGTVTEEYKKLIFLAAMNLPAEGGNVPMRPDALPDDGKISALVADGIGKVRAFISLPKLVAAKHSGIRGFHFEDAKYIDIELERPAVLHVDGEYYGDVSNIHIESCYKKLKLL
ncbi:MAG: YegS/Rv2252/BmrU family lipid kinase [Eubacterium sp.]|nr:YegS/Rv2252/BmrU family lipid kinase [Eubacterium sp.]